MGDRQRIRIGFKPAIYRRDYCGGLFGVFAALLIILIALTSEPEPGTPRWIFIAASLPFLLIGLYSLEFYKLWGGTKERWDRRIGGGIMILASVIALIVPLLDDPETPADNPPPPLIMIAAAVIFFLGGIAILKEADQKFSQGILPILISTIIVTLFAGITVLMAMGGLCFVPGAVMLVGFSIMMWRNLIQEMVRLFRNRKTASARSGFPSAPNDENAQN